MCRLSLHISDFLSRRTSFYCLHINDNFSVKLIINNKTENDFLLDIKDGTVISSSYLGIKRFLVKTMEQLPILVEFADDEDNDSYNYENFVEKVIYMYQLIDKRVIACYQNGKNEVCQLKHI